MMASGPGKEIGRRMAEAKRERRGGSGAPALDRRALLKLAVAAPLAAPLAPLLAACGEGGAPRPAKDRIVVVGGGLSGLRTLDLLVAAGREAVLLEAAPRLGGRVLTLREESGFARGLRAEAGAERVGSNQRRVNGLMIELGLKAEPYLPRRNPEVLHWEGRRHVMSRREDAGELLARLNPAEREGFPDQIHVVLATAAEAPTDDDPRTALEWLRALGMSPTGEALVRTFCPYPVDGVPAAALAAIARREAEMLQAGGGGTIRGGSDLLVHRLAARHQERIVTSRPVREVDWDGDGVTVTARPKPGEDEVYHGKAAIFCVPVAGLMAVSFLRTQGVPPPLLRRMGDLMPVDEIKVHLQVPASVFEDTGLSDYTRRQEFPRVTWRMPEESPDGQIVLNALALREDLLEVRESLAARPPRIEELVRERMPQVAREATLVRGVNLGFSAERLNGGWAFAVGRSAEARRGRPVRIGPLIVAGGDLSEEPGWMEGALASAEAAVREVLG